MEDERKEKGNNEEKKGNGDNDNKRDCEICPDNQVCSRNPCILEMEL